MKLKSSQVCNNDHIFWFIVLNGTTANTQRSGKSLHHAAAICLIIYQQVQLFVCLFISKYISYVQFGINHMTETGSHKKQTHKKQHPTN